MTSIFNWSIHWYQLIIDSLTEVSIASLTRVSGECCKSDEKLLLKILVRDWKTQLTLEQFFPYTSQVTALHFFNGILLWRVKSWWLLDTCVFSVGTSVAINSGWPTSHIKSKRLLKPYASLCSKVDVWIQIDLPNPTYPKQGFYA